MAERDGTNTLDLPLARLLAVLHDVLQGLDAAQTQLRLPGAEGKWSIQQIVEHLLLTYGSSVQAMEARLDKGRPTQARVAWRQRLPRFFVLRLGVLPAGRQAPEAVRPGVPVEPQSGAMLLERVDTALAQLDGMTQAVVASFGPCRSVRHMVLGPMSPQEWLRFHEVHGRLHAGQIRAIREAHGV
ncbi:MAG: DinB family protein [Acidobacteriota bacterium]|nr:DinB family protein [Acidobacteriota bacterium]